MPRSTYGVFEKVFEPKSQAQYTKVVAIEFQINKKTAILHLRPAAEKIVPQVEEIATPKPVEMQLGTEKWKQTAQGPVVYLNFPQPVTVSHSGTALYIEPE
jgi:hypothetical protein